MLLPNEILLQIIGHLEKKDMYQCLFVNRQWLTATQMILYKEISIDIGFTDEIYDNLMINTLVKSPFTPGHWVKKITIARLKLPDNIYSLDYTNDPLYLVMSHCPFVEQFCFDKTNYILNLEWHYVLKVISENGSVWRLRNFAVNFNSKDYKYYYDCACLMQSSLQHFYLKEKMNDYRYHFKGFERITHLHIGRKVIDNILYSDAILSCLPQLKHLEVSFYIPATNNIKKRDHSARIVTKDDYSTIRSVILKNTPLSNDQELYYFINKFKKLQELNIKFGKGKPWPITNITTHVWTIFFDYLKMIPNYSITFREIDLIFILKEYYTFKPSSRFELCLTNLLDKGPKSTNLELTNDSIMMTYNLIEGNDLDQRLLKIKRMLFMIGLYVYDIHLTTTTKIKNINYYLNLLFECCPELKSITVIGGEYTSATLKIIPAKVSAIKTLVFKKSMIDTFAFTRLTFFLPFLDMFKLDDCEFTQYDVIKFSMSQTTFRKLVLSFKEKSILQQEELTVNKKQILFFTLTANNTSQYYCGDPNNKLHQIDKDMYFQDLKRLRYSTEFQMCVLLVNVKAITESFTLVTRYNQLITNTRRLPTA